MQGDIVDSSRERFRVVRNHEDQYSFWPAQRQLPAGWNEAGPTGSREDCLGYIRQIWTDMRPRSVRDAVATESSPASSRGT